MFLFPPFCEHKHLEIVSVNAAGGPLKSSKGPPGHLQFYRTGEMLERVARSRETFECERNMCAIVPNRLSAGRDADDRAGSYWFGAGSDCVRGRSFVHGRPQPNKKTNYSISDLGHLVYRTCRSSSRASMGPSKPLVPLAPNPPLRHFAQTVKVLR